MTLTPPPTPMDRLSTEKMNKKTQALNDTLGQTDLIDIFRIFIQTQKNTLSSQMPHGTFSNIDHILGHKSSLGKFKKTEVVSSIFSD